ncbi:GNAT family N-acetyltransferase [Mucilaginibacter gotjawali]|uniref:Phosphinothricin acetyltransferase n=2 Tax=Mucilaginibacter gotjawali TaxID=1550579 RepID=A0A839SII1_9SPHI|nr:GNAT family N-acetyltransferase [Mucilaginibacter gotjawali]MBB3057202.1 phosphinothricin acetyltransferase [Mucilaginibacter gotjawali]BAU53031.1 putative phosphinothricin acetyltransferase YwnH [Mucilaginibacter gotjawali]
MEIAELTQKQWPEVRAIYQGGIATGNAHFSLDVPEWDEWDHEHVKNCRLVAIDNGEVLGWAALTAISDRCVFAGVAEVSIYIAEKARGKGIGKKLLAELVKQSEQNNFWTLEARIFAENTASIHIHQQNGFRIVGLRERIGKLNGVWRDVLLLERRSTETGI